MTQDMVLPTETHKKITAAAVCEAYNCDKAATDQIKVNAGVFGDVDLNLCKNCIPKFSSQVKYGSSDHTAPVDGKKEVYNNEYVSTA